MKSTRILKALIISSTLFAVSSQASVAHLQLEGTPGDDITSGKTINETYSSASGRLEWNFAFFDNIGTTNTPLTNWLSFYFLPFERFGGYQKSAGLNFTTEMLGVPLTSGTSYEDVQRAPFASPGHAGLDIDYGGRGCTNVSGSFTVERLKLSADTIDEFRATFVQSCNGGAAMHGAFYYNAHLSTLPPSEVPVPATMALLGVGAAGLGIARRRKHAR